MVQRNKRRGTKYLRKGWAEKKWKRVIKYRVGDVMREGLSWEEKKKRKCRVCDREKKMWEHI